MVLVFNLALPYLLRLDMLKMVFWTRVGYFVFWAFWTMTAFDGLILWIFTHQKLPATVWVMIVASVVLPFVDGYRAIRLKKLWLSQDDGVGFNTMIVTSEIVLTLVTILYGIYGG